MADITDTDLAVMDEMNAMEDDGCPVPMTQVAPIKAEKRNKDEEEDSAEAAEEAPAPKRIKTKEERKQAQRPTDNDDEEEDHYSSAATKKTGVKEMDIEEFITQYFGRADPYQVFYKSITPSHMFELTLTEASPDKYNASVAAKKAAKQWTEDDEKNYIKRQKSTTAGRYITYSRKKMVAQLVRKMDRGGDHNGYTYYLCGQALPFAPGALVMTPLGVIQRCMIGERANLDDEKYPPKNYGMSEQRFIFTDRPIRDRPGYNNEDNRNPHAEDYYEWVCDKLQDEGIFAQLFAPSSAMAKSIRGKAETAVLEAMIKEIRQKAANGEEESSSSASASSKKKKGQAEEDDSKKKKKKPLTENEIRKMIESDKELLAEKTERVQTELKNMSLNMVRVSGTEDQELQHNVKYQSFKRSLFRRLFTQQAQEEVRAKIAAGKYNHLPTKIVQQLDAEGGKLDYNGIMVFRVKTAAEFNDIEAMRADPHPFVLLTYAERELINEFEGCVLYEPQVTEDNTKNKAGPQDGQPLAVFIFRSYNTSAGGRQRPASSSWEAGKYSIKGL